MEHNSRDPKSSLWELRKFDRARRIAAMQMMRDLPLQDPAQQILMMCIHQASRDGNLHSQRELAKMTQRSPATVTASLKVLEREGLICRFPDDADQRVNRVELTRAGLDLAGECCRRIAVLDEQMIAGLSPEDREHLSRIFQKMADNLSSMTEENKGAGSID